MTRDKQLSRIKFKVVLEKCRRDQALNAKQFAVLAGVSYSTAREWFQLPGFPRVQGVVFWQDFVEWRKVQNARKSQPVHNLPPFLPRAMTETAELSGKAARILHESKK